MCRTVVQKDMARSSTPLNRYASCIGNKGFVKPLLKIESSHPPIERVGTLHWRGIQVDLVETPWCKQSAHAERLQFVAPRPVACNKQGPVVPLLVPMAGQLVVLAGKGVVQHHLVKQGCFRCFIFAEGISFVPQPVAPHLQSKTSPDIFTWWIPCCFFLWCSYSFVAWKLVSPLSASLRPGSEPGPRDQRLAVPKAAVGRTSWKLPDLVEGPWQFRSHWSWYNHLSPLPSGTCNVWSPPPSTPTMCSRMPVSLETVGLRLTVLQNDF